VIFDTFSSMLPVLETVSVFVGQGARVGDHGPEVDIGGAQGEGVECSRG